MCMYVRMYVCMYVCMQFGWVIVSVVVKHKTLLPQLKFETTSVVLHVLKFQSSDQLSLCISFNEEIAPCLWMNGKSNICPLLFTKPDIRTRTQTSLTEVSQLVPRPTCVEISDHQNLYIEGVHWVLLCPMNVHLRPKPCVQNFSLIGIPAAQEQLLKEEFPEVIHYRGLGCDDSSILCALYISIPTEKLCQQLACQVERCKCKVYYCIQ